MNSKTFIVNTVVDKQKLSIFAYLRRSTKKKEQEESLVQQEDGIDSIVRKLGFEKEDIRYFAETHSGFENKTRKQFGEMIKAIDGLRGSCIILTRDTSRLSRNPTDSKIVMDRLYGDNKKKRKIERIIFLDYDNIREWTKETDKEVVHKQLSAGYYDSLDTRRKSIGGHILKLGNGIFTYTPPKGLSKFPHNGSQVLKQNEKMPFVRRAFEMKAEGKNHKEISKYLKECGGINIGDRDLTERLFGNIIYIGEYIEKTTGSHFYDLKFFEGKPPISSALWNAVQKCRGRKISNYGEKQEGDILADKLRTESGRRMSKYLAKAKYPNYKNTVERINIGEKEILQHFMDVVGLLLSAFLEDTNNFNTFHQKYLLTLLCVDEGKKILQDKGIEFQDIYNSLSPEKKMEYQNAGFIGEELELRYLATLGRHTLESNKGKISLPKSDKKDWGKLFKQILSETSTEKVVKRTIENFVDTIRIKYFDQIASVKQFNTQKTKELELEKQKLEQDRRDYRKKAVILGLSIEEIEETSKDIDKSIKLIEKQMSNFSDDSEIEQYLNRLPEVLLKTFELSGNAVQKRKFEDMKAEILKLLELITFELTISNKKELKIKLFDVLDRLISDDYSVLEAPSGVEPDYEALQAPT